MIGNCINVVVLVLLSFAVFSRALTQVVLVQVRGLYTNCSDLDSGWDASNLVRMKAAECGVNIVSSNYVQPLDLSGCVRAACATRGCVSHHVVISAFAAQSPHA